MASPTLKFLSEVRSKQDYAAATRPIVSTAAMIAEADAVLAQSQALLAANAQFNGRIFVHTKSNDPVADKVTYSHFVKTVWAMSRTNLHIKDFEAEFGAELTRIFHPVPLKNGSAA